MIVKALVLCCFLGLFCLGVYDVLKNFEDNNCEMTYMYEMPEYLKIKLSRNVSARFPRYNLYFYGEGQYAWDSKNSKFQLSGIPVLFIPGNAGSYRQVRSLGSVALRMANSLRAKFQFNFFALDLNEEFSGIYGPVLMPQTEFTYECIKKILTLYSGMTKNKPTSVFLVGHSMGGMIARALYTLPDFDSSLVNGILTQATPHQIPVIAVDRYLVDFYARVNSAWSNHSNAWLESVCIASTGGGHRDNIVRNGLTSLGKAVDSALQISASTMSVPKAWVSTDHLAHVWCRQIVLATVRAMFDYVDKKTNQLSDDHQLCHKAFFYHYQQNCGPKFLPASNSETTVDSKVQWTKSKELSWKFAAQQVADEFYQVFEIEQSVASRSTLFALTNLDKGSWIGGCSVEQGDSKCKEVTYFDDEIHVIPPREANRKAIVLNGNRLSKFTHLVVHVPKSKSPVKIVVDVYDDTKYSEEFAIPHFLYFVGHSVATLDSKVVVLDSTPKDAPFYNLTLLGLESPFQAYVVEISDLQCHEKNSDFTSVIKLFVPWNHEHTFSTFRRGDTGRLSLKLQSGKPTDFSDDVQLHLYLDPSCTYRVTVRLSWSELFGQFVRFYGPFIPAFVVIQVIMAISWQLKKIASDGGVPKFSESHSSWALPYRVVPVAMGLRFLLSKFGDNDVIRAFGLPPDDTTVVRDLEIWHPLVPLLLYVFSFAFMTFYGRMLEGVLMLLSNICAACCQRFFNSSSTGAIFSALQYLVLLCGAAASYLLCGTLGLIVAYLVQITKALVCRTRAKLDPGKNPSPAFNFSVSLAILLHAMLALNVVPFVVWTKGLPWGSVSLPVDSSQTIGIFACLSTIVLTYTDYSFEANLMTSSLTKVTYLSSVLMVIYTLVSVYRISYFVSTVLILMALSSLTVVRSN